ncbi:MAG: SH3 domain-containing protein [Lachnospiraceae bacterium]|nr:SH3 domain-containing protein [Lachnospiraceae bacterium]
MKVNNNDNRENDNRKRNKDTQTDMVTFFKKNARYLVGAAALIVLLVILVKFTGGSEKQNLVEGTEITEIAGADGTYEVDENQDINNLITNYYTAYANGDVDTIAALATPLSENEKSYITMFSQYVEAYQSISCYVKQGLDDKSYLVSVYLEMKLNGIDTVAPGLSTFYVQTKEDGSLYINNVYSQYNTSHKEEAFDPEIEKLYEKYEAQEDVKKLCSDVQKKYEAALAADTNLANMMGTIADAYNAWSASLSATEEQPAEQPADAVQPEQPQDTAQPEEQPVAEQPAEQAQDANVQAMNDTVYALDTVNIRSAADQNSSAVGSATIGASFTRTGVSGDWSQVQYNGGTAYIKTEFLTTDASQTAKSSTANTAAVGENIRLSDTINVRSSMGEDADRLGVAYAGENVKVVESYAEGWSKVEWNGQTGYVKTDLLK